MAREEQLFSLQCELHDADFEAVYQIYLETERQKERRIPIIISLVLAAASIVIAIAMKNITFVFYALFFVAGGFSYRFVPANRKFLATNRLLLGETRELTFYPHEIGSLDVLEDDTDLSEEEREESTTYFSTGNMHAYETVKGFLFADGSIVNGFLYVPKRGLDDEMLTQLHGFAVDRCSGGYLMIQSMLAEPLEPEEDAQSDEDAAALDADALCDAYYGVKKLRIFDENGNRIRDFGAEDAAGADIAEEEDADAT